MRSSRQQLYDHLYYSFERWLLAFCENVRTWKQFLGVKFSKEFYDTYKNTICPYWAKFGIKPKLHWTKFVYSQTGKMDPRYIPEDIYVRDIIPHFNPHMYVRPMADKNLNNIFLPDVKRPETAFKHMSGLFCDDNFLPITREDAIGRIQEDGSYVIKPATGSSQGKNVTFFLGSIGKSAIGDILDQYDTIDYLVQRAIVQHPDLNRLNASSINTIRPITLLLNGKPLLLSTAIRFGAPGSRVDNLGSGGYQCNIRSDGTLAKTAFTHRNGRNELIEKTADGIQIDGFPVPCYDAVCKVALDCAARIPHVKLVAWDFAVDENGEVVLIEFNTIIPGQSQETSGPTFREYTDEVLAEVFLSKKGEAAKALNKDTITV